MESSTKPQKCKVTWTANNTRWLFWHTNHFPQFPPVLSLCVCVCARARLRRVFAEHFYRALIFVGVQFIFIIHSPLDALAKFDSYWHFFSIFSILVSHWVQLYLFYADVCIAKWVDDWHTEMKTLNGNPHIYPSFDSLLSKVFVVVGCTNLMQWTHSLDWQRFTVFVFVLLFVCADWKMVLGYVIPYKKCTKKQHQQKTRAIYIEVKTRVSVHVLNVI